MRVNLSELELAARWCQHLGYGQKYECLASERSGQDRIVICVYIYICLYICHSTFDIEFNISNLSRSNL